MGVRSTLQDLGAVNTALYAADRLFGFLTRGLLRVRRYLFVVQPLPRATSLSKRARPNMVIRELTVDDIGRLPFPVPQEVLHKRLKHRPLCLLMEIGGTFAAYGWFHTGPYSEDEVRCLFVPEPAESTAWDYDIFVAPEFRNSRAFALLWEAAGERLRARGITHTASRISAFNIASIRSHVRGMGAHVVGSAVFVSCGKMELLLSAARIALTMSAVPEIRVRAS